MRGGSLSQPSLFGSSTAAADILAADDDDDDGDDATQPPAASCSRICEQTFHVYANKFSLTAAARRTIHTASEVVVRPSLP